VALRHRPRDVVPDLELERLPDRHHLLLVLS
jgi:hypothetical protein